MRPARSIVRLLYRRVNATGNVLCCICDGVLNTT
jgi:hypothetical protein